MVSGVSCSSDTVYMYTTYIFHMKLLYGKYLNFSTIWENEGLSPAWAAGCVGTRKLSVDGILKF